MQGLEFRASGSGLRVQGLGPSASGQGFEPLLSAELLLCFRLGVRYKG